MRKVVKTILILLMISALCLMQVSYGNQVSSAQQAFGVPSTDSGEGTKIIPSI